MMWALRHVVLTIPPPTASTTVFAVDEHEVFVNLLQQMQRECPSVFTRFELHRYFDAVVYQAR